MGLMAAYTLLQTGCGDLTVTPDGTSTLGSLIDTLIPNVDAPDADFPDIVPPDESTPNDATPDGEPVIDGGIETPPPDDTVTEDDVIPDNAYCDAVVSWPAANVEFEDEVLVLVNERRAVGADCGSGGTFGPADPLASAGDLRCAARNHSLDMATRGFFDHTNPDGDGPGERLEAAGFSGFGWGENIAWGQRTPQQVVDGWMGSDGHCRNIMNPDFTEIGVGYHGANYWTQTFGSR